MGNQVDKEDLGFYSMELEILIQEAIKAGIHYIDHNDRDVYCNILECKHCSNIFDRSRIFIDYTAMRSTKNLQAFIEKHRHCNGR